MLVVLSIIRNKTDLMIPSFGPAYAKVIFVIGVRCHYCINIACSEDSVYQYLSPYNCAFSRYRNKITHLVSSKFIHAVSNFFAVGISHHFVQLWIKVTFCPRWWPVIMDPNGEINFGLWRLYFQQPANPVLVFIHHHLRLGVRIFV